MNDSERSWNLLCARTRYWTWWIVTKVCLGLVCVGIISEGLRLFVPVLGQKLYRLPLLAFLKNFEETRGLDIAPFLALFFMVSVWILLEKMLKVWVPPAYLVKDELPKDTDEEARFVTGLSVVLVAMDALLFYSAIVQTRWGGSSFSAAALIATAAYLSVLIFISYLTIRLQRHIEYLEQGTTQ